MSKHNSLALLRQKLLDALGFSSKGKVSRSKKDQALAKRIMTSVSKSDLEELYAPYKPPHKGSVLQQIQEEHPKLVEGLEELWLSENHDNPSVSQDLAKINKLCKEYPKEAIISWLGSKIASEPMMGEIVWDQLQRYGRLVTKPTFPSTLKKSGKFSSKAKDNAKVYETYHDFSVPLRSSIKDFQVLAIRRGVTQKALRMSYEIDGDKMESSLRYHLRQGAAGKDSGSDYALIPAWLKRKDNLLTDAVHDAWSRLLRRRGTQKWWNERCKEAQERACWVFANNLERALLAPPLQPTRPLLALDPGYQAGIKCAVLDASGKVERLATVQFLGKHKDRAVSQLQDLLQTTRAIDPSGSSAKVLVALGNGHGT
ncbi:MAG: hypothetical protein SGBAC_013439, partial [Bacillariaceae sp.]